MSVTDEIKSRIDIVSYVQRHVPTLKKAGRNHKACCPFHSEKTPSFVVNPVRQTWYCFGACAEGGDLFNFAQKVHNWDFKEALREWRVKRACSWKRKLRRKRTRVIAWSSCAAWWRAPPSFISGNCAASWRLAFDST